MEASGVRRSCETALSSELRICSVSARSFASRASAEIRERSIASAICVANISSRWICSGDVARGRFRQDCHHSDDMRRAPQRKVKRRRTRKSVRAPSRTLLVVKGPLSDALLRARNRQVIRRAPAEGDFAGTLRQKDYDPAAEDFTGDIRAIRAASKAR